MPKVLMLGWEFPPQISGGLGVACEAMTSALLRTGQVEILFVIPKSPEVSSANGTRVVGADSLSIESMLPGIVTTTSQQGWSIAGPLKSYLEVMKVEAALTPYETRDSSNEYLARWNAVIGEHLAGADGVVQHPGKPVRQRKTLSFQGGYGRNLLQEVDRYAEVIANAAMTRAFDVVHAHDWMTFPAAIALKETTGKPMIVHFHSTEFDRAGDRGSEIVFEIERRAVVAADIVVAVSRLTRSILVERYGADPDRVVVVHNAISNDGTQDIPAGRHPLGDKVVTFLGRVTFQKGPEYFVEAAEKVLKEFPDCHFVMAGAGDALPGIVARVAGSSLASHFHFTGFLHRADTGRLLGLTRVYVMPSVSEPFGLTALEAIQAGVPTIISRQSGVAEVMPDVLKVDFWDTDALAEVICSVLRYPLLADALRRNASKSLHRITWHLAAEKLLDIYRKVTRRDGHRYQSTGE